MDTYVVCSLIFETENVDYTEIFKPISYFEPPPHLDIDPLHIFKPMNIISWNVRSAAGADFRRIFREMIDSYKPDLVILSETRLSGQRAESIISTLGFNNHLKVDAMGFTGGIWVLWPSEAIQVEPISNAFHEMYFKIQVHSALFILIALYASLKFSIRKILWNKLEQILEFINLPWLIMGDFNEIANQNEKFGGRPPNRIKFETFNLFLQKAKLIDLGFSGPKYTWTNCTQDGSLIRTRIDRAHANAEWINLFPETKVYHLPRLRSNHNPILLTTNTPTIKGTKPFRFKPFWMQHQDFIELTGNI